MWAVIIWVVFGLVVGLIAKALMAQRHKSNLVATILLGAGGGLLGGILSRLIFSPNSGTTGGALDERGAMAGGFLIDLLFAVFGAIVLSAIYQIVLNNKES